MSIFDEKHCAEFAKTLTAMCVRNAEIEHLHAGEHFVTKTGDYSDVKVLASPFFAQNAFSDALIEIEQKSVVSSIRSLSPSFKR